ncbi:Rnf electron transport complex subunit RnfD [Methanohalophilus sp.]
MTLTISAPPHIKQDTTFRKITWIKFLALLPVSLVSVYFFGLYALALILAGIGMAVVTEVVIQKAFKKEVTVANGHAPLIGLMVALLVPGEAPIWVPIVGALFAVAIGKHAFGGIGSYIFNPVLVAWVFLQLAYWSAMYPVSFPELGGISDLFLENGAGMLVGVSPIALVGGLYLILKRYVEWKVPLFYALTTLVLALLIGDKIGHVVTGAFVFGVLFLATDSPSSPVTKNGRIIYGILCGLLTVIYGHFANYVFAVFYGIFLANCVAAFIDNSTLPRSFGEESLLQRKYRLLVNKIPLEKLGVKIDD